MDILLAILCVLALLLLFVGQREGFTGNCGTAGVPAAENNTLRVYTPEECTSLGGRFYDDGASAGVPGYGLCTSNTGTHLADISTDCAFLNSTPAAPAAPAVPPAPQVTSTTAPLPAAMPTPTGGNTLTSLPIPGMPPMAPQAAAVMTSTPVGAPLGSGAPHGILLTMV